MSNVGIKAQDALAIPEQELRLVVDTIPTLVWTAAPGGDIEYVNKRVLEYFGAPLGEIVGWGWAERVHPEDVAFKVGNWLNSLETENPHNVVCRFRGADGRYRWCNVRGEPLRANDGTVLSWYGVLIDIDDQRRAEESLRESEHKLRQIFETEPGLIWSTDSEGSEGKKAEVRLGFVPQLQAILNVLPAYTWYAAPRGALTFVNKRTGDYLGVANDHPLRFGIDVGAEWDHSFALLHPDDREDARKYWSSRLRTGEGGEHSYRVRGVQGHYRWFLTRMEPLRASDGTLLLWLGATLDIEEPMRAQEALRESEQNLQTIIDTIPALVVRYRADGTADFMNQTTREFVGPGLRLEEMKSAVHPDDIPQNLRDWSERVAAGEPHENEIRLRRADGAYRWHHIRRVPVRDESGAIVNWYGSGHDIDDHKRAEQALRESEARLAEAQRELQTMIDSIPAMVTRYDAKGSLTYANKRVLDYTGLSAVEVITDKERLEMVVHSDELDQTHSQLRASIAEGEPFQAEVRLRRRDGEYRWASMHRVPLRDSSGKVVRWYGVAVDIEDRKRAEQALRRSEAHLAEAQRLSHTGASAYNATALLYWSEELYRITGFDPRDGLPNREAVWQRIHPDDRSRLRAEVELARNGKGGFSSAFRLVLPDGTVKYIESIRQPVFSTNGELVEMVATHIDVTERKRAEHALRRSRAYLAEAQRLSCTGSFGWRIADNLIAWSQETYRILELDPAVKPTLEHVLARTHPDDIELVRGMLERMVNEDREFDFEHRLLLPDGTIKHLQVRTHRVRFESSEAEVVGALMDVTAAREAEEALRRAQAELAHAARVATLGELSASIAHEVHQPLTAIVASGNAAIRWLDREVPERARAIRSVTRMISEANRASQVILRIRELAKKAEPVMSQVDVNRLIEDVLVLISREATAQGVEVRSELASELPPALGDRVQLQQVLINLVMNGIQAMVPVTGRARVLVIRTQRHDANQILVAVEDRGIGIESENLNRLFGAFYTTKPDGMGMGLSISRSIVETHGGSIQATRNSGPGMTFQFTLSLYREQAAASSPIS
jgi:PAS domain S-box-containing protein